jgi:hypothetical protein
MVNREHIQSLLKINGVHPMSPDDQVRSILLSARYSKDEVDMAIMVLREDIKTKLTRVDGLHKVYRTGERLTSEEISKLLGIEVTLNEPNQVVKHRQQAPVGQLMLLWVLSVGIALFGILSYMYVHQFGPFYPGMQASVSL